jgi:hypothetical protein
MLFLRNNLDGPEPERLLVFKVRPDLSNYFGKLSLNTIHSEPLRALYD